MNDKIDSLSEQELRDNLTTLDYRGREFKKLCLDRLIEIEREKAFLEVRTAACGLV